MVHVEEAGTVSLTSSSPRVGDRLTASLSDPDGYQSGGRQQWLQFHGGRDGDDDSWEEDESVRYAADSYTVPPSRKVGGCAHGLAAIPTDMGPAKPPTVA